MRFELAPLVEEVGDSLGLPREGQIDWMPDLEEGLEVDADRDQLYRVLANLCRNAVQAFESEPGCIGTISVFARREGAVVMIDVADTGPGVPEQARDRLFQAFQSVARKGGSGLGLAISAELVKAMAVRSSWSTSRVRALPSPSPTWKRSWSGRGAA